MKVAPTITVDRVVDLRRGSSAPTMGKCHGRDVTMIMEMIAITTMIGMATTGTPTIITMAATVTTTIAITAMIIMTDPIITDMIMTGTIAMVVTIITMEVGDLTTISSNNNISSINNHNSNINHNNTINHSSYPSNPTRVFTRGCQLRHLPSINLHPFLGFLSSLLGSRVRLGCLEVGFRVLRLRVLRFLLLV